MKLGYRHLVATLIMLSTMIGYFGRMNLSTAIVDMAKHHNTTNTTTSSSSSSSAKHFDWNEKTQGVILGSFFYGYFALQLITGRLTEIIGPRLLGTIGLASTALINFLTPLLAEYYGWFVASRVLMGILQAGIYPCAFALASHWIPDNERSTVTSMAYIGGNLGTIIASSSSGWLCKHGFAGGWPSVFYVTGIIATIITIIYWLFISNNPEDNGNINQNELDYIRNNINTSNDNRKKLPVPWMHFLKSPPVYAGIFSQFSMMWAITVMMTKLPDYMHNVMKISIEKTGFFGSALYLAESLSLFFGGIIADMIIKRGRFSKNQIRKSFQALAAFGSSIGLFIIPSLGPDAGMFLLVMIISMSMLGLQSGGIVPLPADLTNEFTATIFGLFNMIAMTSGIIGPYVIGAMLDADPSHPYKQWMIVWYFTAILRIVSGLVFILIGSAENQGWDLLHLN
ncbi:sialin-like protein [Euroglyphus maynei]|uniref:Sialin-like protein n=1 Tax=Euroglyphus maynei TaxID=6958 RepID=A0A1Y3BQA3_EURMA|nr:sialin-like protein [Euroglyphus maynei]